MDRTVPSRVESRRLRVYQQWQGNERFFCGGRCMAGPNWRSCIGSVLLILAPTVVFLVWVAFYMGRKVSWAIFAASCVMPALCLAWLLLTACRDPGVLPRQEPDEEWLSGRIPRTKEVIVHGHPVQVRYNDTCHFYQPPRAHHCSVNDNCIERFDHHCPWVGTTIGKRNYRTFLLFIYGTTVYILWTLAISLWSFWVKARELQAAAGPKGKPVDVLTVIAANPAAVALCVFCFVFFWFVGGLSGFHTFLVATNQTTYENFSNQRRHSPGSVVNPYDEGILRNCASVWCTPVPPPKIDYRAYVGDVRKAQASASDRRVDLPSSYYGPSDDDGGRSGRASSSAGGLSSAALGGSGAFGGASGHAPAAAPAPVVDMHGRLQTLAGPDSGSVFHSAASEQEAVHSRLPVHPAQAQPGPPAGQGPLAAGAGPWAGAAAGPEQVGVELGAPTNAAAPAAVPGPLTAARQQQQQQQPWRQQQQWQQHEPGQAQQQYQRDQQAKPQRQYQPTPNGQGGRLQQSPLPPP